MSGSDHDGCGGLATGATTPAIGVENGPDIANVVAGIPSNRLDHYTGDPSAASAVTRRREH